MAKIRPRPSVGWRLEHDPEKWEAVFGKYHAQTNDVSRDKMKIAIATGDPADIGPEVSLKAALDPAVRAICRPVVIGDRGVLEAHAKRCGLSLERLELVERKQLKPGELRIGIIDAAHGRATLDSAEAAIEDARRAGIAVDGPVGADTLIQKPGYDACVVMFHDQGHVAAKQLALNRAAAFAIGTPVLFSSVAHGSVLDIAGQNRASPAALIEAVQRLAGAHTLTRVAAG